MADPGEIRVQDEQGTIHVFPPGSTPEMISQVMNVKPPAQEAGFWDKIKSSLGSHALSDQARTDYLKKGGDVGNPGVSEGAGLREGLAEYDKASGGEVAGGVHDILQGNVARGLHRILGGVGNAAMPMAPFAAPAAAAAPISTALSVAGAAGGSKLASSGASALGATPDQSALAGDVGGLAGGFAGAKLSGLAQRAALLGRTPAEAYQSALKPSTTIRPAKVARIVQTGLQEGIPVSPAGMEKLSSLIDDVNDKISAEIGAGKGKTIDPQAVAQRADQVKGRFANQVNPTADLQAIDASKQEFLANNQRPIPAADAQAMKVGTYQQLSSKAYGELKSASIEAQKALARGLKEELATAFPELKNLNAQDSKLLDLKPILEKALQREANHQLGGIGTPITAGATKAVTGSNTLSAAAGLLKAVVDNPNIKSRLAIALSKNGVTLPAANARIQAYSAALAASAANNEAPDSRTGAQQP